jgi:hypothetical protein
MEVISIVLMIDADGFIAVLFCGGDSLQDIFCFHVQGLFGHVSLPVNIQQKDFLNSSCRQAA